MLEFRPLRASPPIRAAQLAKSLSSTVGDASQSSALSVPELTNLLPADVELLDAVIARAGPSATTFLTVFKAYNEVLQERDLDANEVVYYGKLLKLGTLKGRNWGEKWNLVKAQNGFIDQSSRPSGRTSTAPLRRLTQASRREAHSSTLFSNLNEVDTEPASSEAELTGFDEPQYHDTPRQTRRPTSPTQSTFTIGTTTDFDVDSKRYPILAPPPSRPISLPPRQAAHRWRSVESDETDDMPSTTPPSYRAATRETPRPAQQLNQQPTRLRSSPSDDPAYDRVAAARQAIAQARQRRGSVVNEEDAWKKIEMQRDEEEADRFREDKLLERCWEIWKQEFNWIITTHEQISEARDNIILRLSVQKWRTKIASQRELYGRVASLSNQRMLRRILSAWKAKYRLKKQTQWRRDMRSKMKLVRDGHDARLQKNAWEKWRQSHRLQASGDHYTQTLVARFFRQWKRRLVALEQQEILVDDFIQNSNVTALHNHWLRWKRTLELHNAERVVDERVSLRIMGSAMFAWKQRMRENSVADAYYDSVVLQRAVKSWKVARSRIRALESRADKHSARQDDVLLIAVARVWKARERGRLLERVRALRLLKSVWAKWRGALAQQYQRESLAINFTRRPASYAVVGAFRQWARVHQTLKNSHAFALQYHSAHLQYGFLLAWRLRLRDHLKLAKQARTAEGYLIARRALKQWSDKLAEKRREKKLKEFEVAKLRQQFNVWAQRTRRSRQCRLAEETVQALVNLRIMTNALTRWTNKVIDLKLRELEVSQRRDAALTRTMFKKWKGICIRHVEELDLMESYQYIKREEFVKRIFNRWLVSARASRHRRLTLQKKEHELNLAVMSVAWDKWRDKFVEERLRSVEYDVAHQTARNLLFRNFGIWHAKTKTLPAIRFHASYTKAKYWKIWRAAMPHALLVKTARDKDKHNVLSKYLDKWVQVYRTKMALKAVARARYLRLPTATPRQAASSRPQQPYSTPRARVSRRIAEPETSDAENDAGAAYKTPLSKAHGGRTGIASLLSSESRSQLNSGGGSAQRDRFIRPKVRDTSPTRSHSSYGGTSGLLQIKGSSSPRPRSRPLSSVGAGEPGSSKLWQELQQIQRRSRPSSARSRSRDPQ
ncbi:hypothetical protein HGRIS_013114 [Hohenbuehelia grisea]|uniref:Sfi1 spindle body domain-containing protein n=1 Tax=Hohenbuehelia grisea TaxID=104357 RepID=A0ABR3IUK1_9AGAR